MQNVDANFIPCITSQSKYEVLLGTITLKDGTSTPLTLEGVKEGTVSITWDSTDGSSDITFGVCVCSELDLTIFTSLDRYSLEGAEITVSYRVWDKKPEYEDGELVNNAIYSDCSLGTFTAYAVTKDTYSSFAHILAYDDIKSLDKPCGSQVFSGTPHTILTQVCNKTGLGFTMTDQQLVDMFPNTTAVLQFDSTTGANTYRDIIRYIGQLLGACGRINRTTGDFELFKYATSTTYTVARTARKQHNPSDYKCKYKGVQLTSVKGTYKSINNAIQDAMVMYIDDAPAWDYGLTDDLRARAVALGDYVRLLDYTPCDATLFSNPMYDCGDNLALAIDDTPSHNVDILVTSVTWNFRGSTELKSVGTNLQDTGVQKETARQLTRNTDSNKLVSYDVTNTEAIELGDNETITLCDVSFTSAQSTHAMWLANILLESEADDDFTDVKITYYYDNEEITFYPQEHYTDGNHDFSLFFPISSIAEASVHRWRVDITSLGGTITIPQYDFRGTLFGQNLVEQGARWDGLLTLEDFLEGIVPLVIFDNLNDASIVVSLHSETQVALVDSMLAMTVNAELQTTTESCTIIFSYREDVCYCGEGYYAGTEGVLL